VAWLETDRAYKDAAERFVSLQNQRQVKAEDEDKSPDYSSETSVKYIGEPPPPLGLDVEGWKTRLRALSGKFKGEGEVHQSHVALQGRRIIRWFMNSEGSLVQFGYRSYRVILTASTQADDGMHLSRFKSFEAWTPEGLPNDAAMSAAIAEIIGGLKDLR